MPDPRNEPTPEERFEAFEQLRSPHPQSELRYLSTTPLDHIPLVDCRDRKSVRLEAFECGGAIFLRESDDFFRNELSRLEIYVPFVKVGVARLRFIAEHFVSVRVDDADAQLITSVIARAYPRHRVEFDQPSLDLEDVQLKSTPARIRSQLRDIESVTNVLLSQAVLNDFGREVPAVARHCAEQLCAKNIPRESACFVYDLIACGVIRNYGALTAVVEKITSKTIAPLTTPTDTEKWRSIRELYVSALQQRRIFYADDLAVVVGVAVGLASMPGSISAKKMFIRMLPRDSEDIPVFLNRARPYLSYSGILSISERRVSLEAVKATRKILTPAMVIEAVLTKQGLEKDVSHLLHSHLALGRRLNSDELDQFLTHARTASVFLKQAQGLILKKDEEHFRDYCAAAEQLFNCNPEEWRLRAKLFVLAAERADYHAEARIKNFSFLRTLAGRLEESPVSLVPLSMILIRYSDLGLDCFRALQISSKFGASQISLYAERLQRLSSINVGPDVFPIELCKLDISASLFETFVSVISKIDLLHAVKVSDRKSAMSKIGSWFALSSAFYEAQLQGLDELLSKKYFATAASARKLIQTKLYDECFRIYVNEPQSRFYGDAVTFLHAGYRIDSPPFTDDDSGKNFESIVRTKREVHRVYNRARELALNFDRWTYEARRTGDGERSFLASMGQKISYSCHALNNESKDSYPGSGFVFDGIKIKNSGFIAPEFEDASASHLLELAAPWARRELPDVARTQFFSLRGLFAVRAPEGYTAQGIHWTYVVFKQGLWNPGDVLALEIPTEHFDAWMQGTTLPEGIFDYQANQPSLSNRFPKPERVASTLGKSAFPLHLTHPSNACGMCNAFPPKRGPYEWQKNPVFQSETRDFAGHVHKSHLLTGYKDVLEGDIETLMQTYRNLHDEVHGLAFRHQNLFDIFRLRTSMYRKGQTLAFDNLEQRTNSPMLEEVYRWNRYWEQGGHAMKVPVLGVGHTFNYFTDPSASVLVDPFSLRILTNGAEIRLPRNADSEETLELWNEFVYPHLTTITADPRFYERGDARIQKLAYMLAGVNKI